MTTTKLLITLLHNSCPYSKFLVQTPLYTVVHLHSLQTNLCIYLHSFQMTFDTVGGTGHSVCETHDIKGIRRRDPPKKILWSTSGVEWGQKSYREYAVSGALSLPYHPPPLPVGQSPLLNIVRRSAKTRSQLEQSGTDNDRPCMPVKPIAHCSTREWRNLVVSSK